MRARFLVDTEPGIVSVLTTYGAPQGAWELPSGGTVLYLGNTSAEEDAERLGWVRALARACAQGYLESREAQGFPLRKQTKKKSKIGSIHFRL